MSAGVYGIDDFAVDGTEVDCLTGAHGVEGVAVDAGGDWLAAVYETGVVAEIAGLVGVVEACESGCFVAGIAELGGFGEVYDSDNFAAGTAEADDFVEVYATGGLVVAIADEIEDHDAAEVPGTGLGKSSPGRTVHCHCTPYTQQRVVCPASNPRSESCLQLSVYVLL